MGCLVYWFFLLSAIKIWEASNDVSNAYFLTLQNPQGVGRIEGAILVPGDCVADVPVTFTL